MINMVIPIIDRKIKILLAVMLSKEIAAVLNNAKSNPDGITCLYFRIMSLKLNRGFIAIVETIPTIRKSNANNPINKY